jgi:DNA-binding NtrC family response regulator
MRKMILIVDDEERILFVLEHALRKLTDGVEVETAGTGGEALRKARKRSFDLVISDLIMPDMDGVELTERIRDLSSECAVIWMTAYGCQSFQAEAERLGVYCCVEKPLEIQRFRDLARRAMALDEEIRPEGRASAPQ